MATPLFDALHALNAAAPLRLHMPGHKGKMPGTFQEISAIDFTEIDPTGNLYEATGPIRKAERCYAEAVGARDALFFTCGSTQGIQTMLAAAVGMGGTLILDRGCHKSAYHSMALLDIAPVYLQGPPLGNTGLSAPISETMLEQTILLHPEASAVLLTTPSYYGIVTPLSDLAALCHRHGKYLLVDQAHGAHFPFVGVPSAIQEGADLSVVSTHKTLPAMGSSAVLTLGETAPWTVKELKSLSALFATTSPSYPILASIDYARELMLGAYGTAYRSMAELVQTYREKINRETPFLALFQKNGLSLDPCRLTIDTAVGGISGHDADNFLQQQQIYVEMADERYLVAILTCCDTPEDLARFFSALGTLPRKIAPLCWDLSLPPAPIIRQSIRSGLFGPKKRLPLKAAVGRICAQIIAPYPPGVPILAPGEEITEKHIAYLQKKSYNIDKDIEVTDDAPYQ